MKVGRSVGQKKRNEHVKVLSASEGRAAKYESPFVCNQMV